MFWSSHWARTNFKPDQARGATSEAIRGWSESEHKSETYSAGGWVTAKHAIAQLRLSNPFGMELMASGILASELGARGRRLSEEDVAAFNSRYISTIEAGELLGCSPQKAVHALRDEKLVAGPPDYCSYLWERESTVAVIERLLSVVEDEPASFIFNAEEHVIATQIMEIMGVNRDTVTLMQKQGLISAVRVSGQYYFSVSEVAAFRERYLCGKDLAEALEANTKNPGMAPIWFAKRLGLVPVFAPPAGRIQIFDRIEFVEAVRKFEIERQAEEERQAKIAEIPVLASLEAAARLRLVPAFLSRVVKAGLLSGEERKRCFVFTIDEIERFERTYILATEASEFIGKKGAMTAVAALARLGVAPVVPYKEIGGYIYEREPALNALGGLPKTVGPQPNE